MKTQNQKLQALVNRINERSKVLLKRNKVIENDHARGLDRGYADAFALVVTWIQEIIDYELQDKESIND